MVWLALLWGEQPLSSTPNWGAQPTPDSVAVTNLCGMSQMPGQASQYRASSGPDADVLPKPLYLWPAPGQSKPEALTLLLRAAKRAPKHIPLANLHRQPLPAQYQLLGCSHCLAGLPYCSLGMGISGSLRFLSHHSPEQKLAPHTLNLPDQAQRTKSITSDWKYALLSCFSCLFLFFWGGVLYHCTSNHLCSMFALDFKGRSVPRDFRLDDAILWTTPPAVEINRIITTSIYIT